LPAFIGLKVSEFSQKGLFFFIKFLIGLTCKRRGMNLAKKHTKDIQKDKEQVVLLLTTVQTVLDPQKLIY
jgi:hypothetical protein